MLFFILLTNASLQTQAEILFTGLDNITSTLKLDQKTGKLYLKEKDLNYKPNFIIRKAEKKKGVVDIMSLSQPDTKIVPYSGKNDFSAFLENIDTGKWKIKRVNDDQYSIMFGGQCLTAENRFVNLRDCVDDDDKQAFFITTDMSTKYDDGVGDPEEKEVGGDNSKHKKKNIKIIEEYNDSDLDVDDTSYSDDEGTPQVKDEAEQKKNVKSSKKPKNSKEADMDSSEKSNLKDILEYNKNNTKPGDTNLSPEKQKKPTEEDKPQKEKDIDRTISSGPKDLKADSVKSKDKNKEELDVSKSQNNKKTVEEYCEEIKQNCEIDETPKIKGPDLDKKAQKNKLEKENEDLETLYKYITQEEKPFAKVLTKTVTVTEHYQHSKKRKKNLKRKKRGYKNTAPKIINPRIKLPKKEKSLKDYEDVFRKESSTIEKIENLFKELGDDNELINEFKQQVSPNRKIKSPQVIQPNTTYANTSPAYAINPNAYFCRNKKLPVNTQPPIVYF